MFVIDCLGFWLHLHSNNSSLFFLGNGHCSRKRSTRENHVSERPHRGLETTHRPSGRHRLRMDGIFPVVWVDARQRSLRPRHLAATRRHAVARPLQRFYRYVVTWFACWEILYLSRLSLLINTCQIRSLNWFLKPLHFDLNLFDAVVVVLIFQSWPHFSLVWAASELVLSVMPAAKHIDRFWFRFSISSVFSHPVSLFWFYPLQPKSLWIPMLHTSRQRTSSLV